jgi:ABC-2 type transport system permease protein
MPWALTALSYVVPLRYMLIIIRGIVLKGVGFSILQSEILTLAVFCAIILALAAVRFRKNLD